MSHQTLAKPSRSAVLDDEMRALARRRAGARGEERVDGLDALRGLMALCVALYHFAVWTQAFRNVPRLSNIVAILGVYSVEGFFIISGFCFVHVYGRMEFSPKSVVSFYLKRFFRIAPLYYLALFLSLALGQAVGPSLSLWRLAENVSLAFGLFHPNHSMVLGGWSIGLELVFYLVLPPLLVLMRRDRRLIYLILAGLLALFIHLNFLVVPNAAFERRFHEYVRLPNHAFLFALGGVISDVRRRVRVRLHSTVIALLSLVVLLLAVVVVGPFRDHFEIMVGATRMWLVAACFLVVALFAWAKERAMTSEALVRLGQISYALYLLHPFAWLLVQNVLPESSPQALRLGIGLCLAIVFAIAATRVIEQPVLRFGRALMSPPSARLGDT